MDQEFKKGKDEGVRLCFMISGLSVETSQRVETQESSESALFTCLAPQATSIGRLGLQTGVPVCMLSVWLGFLTALRLPGRRRGWSVVTWNPEFQKRACTLQSGSCVALRLSLEKITQPLPLPYVG